MRHSFARALIAMLVAGAATAGVGQAPAPPASPAALPPPLPSEDSDTTTLPVASPHMVMINTMWGQVGTRIFDGDSGKMLGLIHTAWLGNVAADPKGRYFYVAETIWSKGNRGTRQDLLTVRDARTLRVVREIALPGRLLVGNRKHDLGISADGRYAYVYNFNPATAIVVVDLEKNRVAQTIEVPGCGLSAAIGSGRALSLCSDGALAVTSVAGRGTVTRSAPFFSAEEDPIFDNFPVDPTGATAMFVSYSGLVYPATLGATASAGAPWSLQEAAGITRGSTKPLLVNWLPGGRQPAAFHKASGRLYVLMHVGEYWSQKQAGTELWVLDAASHAVIKRKKLEDAASFVEVSQDAQPLLFLHDEGKLTILDAMTFEQKHKLEDVGSGPLTVLAAAR